MPALNFLLQCRMQISAGEQENKYLISKNSFLSQQADNLKAIVFRRPLKLNQSIKRINENR